ncbi:MAG: glycosyltransferase [Pseudomonadota bacterium]
MPKVSVVMPAYNVARFIEGAIENVLAQSYTDFELLIVNDGSTDDTVARCQQFTDARIRIVNQANRGLAGARNSGIREARGQYLAFLDADDLWHPDKLALHVAHLDSQPAVGVSYSASQFMAEDGTPLAMFQTPKLEDIEASDVLCRNPIGNGSAPVIRREVFEDIATTVDRYGAPEPVFFDPDFRQSEDIECWVRIAATTEWRFAGLAQPLTLYRINAGGLSASVDRQFASWEAFYAKAAGYAPELIRDHGSLARAYQYRYLARRAIWSGEERTARRLLRKALESNWRIVIREPVRTAATVAAVSLQALLPRPIYRSIERFALSTRAHFKTA